MHFKEIEPTVETWNEHDFLFDNAKDYVKAISALQNAGIKNFGVGLDEERRISTDTKHDAEKIREIIIVL